MKKLMAIFAHPDDEGAMGGTIYKYAHSDDTEVILVCGTRGEVGQISDPSLATPETLGDVRTKELEAAAEALGIQHLEFLDYRDSGMAGTPENDDPRSLVQADPDEVIAKIHALFAKYQPDIVATFEPHGWYGHPDHKAISKWVTEAFEQHIKQSDANPRRLYHSVIPFSRWGGMIEEATEAGYLDPEKLPQFGNAIPREEIEKTEARVTHEVNVRDLYDITQAAMQNHRTQFSPDHMFNKIPKEMRQKYASTEHFIQVYPQPAASAHENRTDDLFD